jgi:ubiquinone/menaquinone biosynthesis C-methylase UbiE
MNNRALASIQAFFGPHAAEWEARTAKDVPQIERAVAECAHRPGATVLDLGCGTGRAVPALRQAVGPTGLIVAIDATAEMVEAAHAAGRAPLAHFIVADVHQLPLHDCSVDAVHAQGILPHLADPASALREWHRVARPGALLAVFHAIGRVTLAAIHRRTPSDDDVLASRRLRHLLDEAGWALESIDDAPERFLALARRRR